MQWLPQLVAPGGAVALPLSQRAATGILVALIAGPDGRADERKLADVLAEDAALALWAACRAAAFGEHGIHDVAALARWLSPRAAEELSRPSSSVSTNPSAVAGPEQYAIWADLNARSLAIARLSERVALHLNREVAPAFFLGLLHAAPQWLAGSNPCESQTSHAMLPAWLSSELATIVGASTANTSPAGECVALALRLAGPSEHAESRPEGFAFDAGVHASEITTERHSLVVGWRTGLDWPPGGETSAAG